MVDDGGLVVLPRREIEMPRTNTPGWILVAVFVGIPVLLLVCCAAMWGPAILHGITENAS